METSIYFCNCSIFVWMFLFRSKYIFPDKRCNQKSVEENFSDLMFACFLFVSWWHLWLYSVLLFGYLHQGETIVGTFSLILSNLRWFGNKFKKKKKKFHDFLIYWILWLFYMWIYLEGESLLKVDNLKKWIYLKEDLLIC